MAEKSPIITAPQAQSSTSKRKKKDEHPRNTPREIAETVVFVVVLVLMLKTFVAEAFVIPTGSMAETLLGYHRMVECPQCGYKFPANCSSEVDPQQGQEPARIIGCICPNCQYPIRWNPDKTAPSWSSGDRVLVAKFLYDRDILWHPHRHEVFVFKYPENPQKHATSMNYIKRCEGLPGETIAIFDGNLYVTRSLTYADRPRPDDPLELWQRQYTYRNDDSALDLFADSMKRNAKGKPAEGDFEIIRDPPDVMLAKRRIVFDADHQPKDVVARGIRRWRIAGDGNWTGDDPASPTIFTHKAGSASLEWMTYANQFGEGVRKEQIDVVTRTGESYLDPPKLFNALNFKSENNSRLIDNMMGYNSDLNEPLPDPNGFYWVSDLMLETEVKVDSDDGEFALELSKGMDRFRASFDIASGECTLVRQTGLTDADREAHQSVLDKKSCKLKGKGTYHVRFANFNERLTVWVSSTGLFSRAELPFGDGVIYTRTADRGPYKENDLDAPAQVGARGAAVQISHLALWRNTYYTLLEELRRGDQGKTTILGQEQKLLTYYVQPGHYLALGDNSASSADSRDWGLVPNRLLLGRALAVYFPFWPFEQRVGLIK